MDMRILFLMAIFLWTTSGLADRKRAEKFFAKDIKPLILTEKGVETDRKTSQSAYSSTMLKKRNLATVEKKALVGVTLGMSQLSLNSNSAEYNLTGWDANFIFLNNQASVLFDRIYELNYSFVASEVGEQKALGAIVQWAWPKLNIFPIYGAAGFGGDHKFGNADFDNDWGIRLKASLGLRLSARHSMFSLEVSRNSRISVLSQSTEHYWSVHSGISILY